MIQHRPINRRSLKPTRSGEPFDVRLLARLARGIVAWSRRPSRSKWEIAAMRLSVVAASRWTIASVAAGCGEATGPGPVQAASSTVRFSKFTGVPSGLTRLPSAAETFALRTAARPQDATTTAPYLGHHDEGVRSRPRSVGSRPLGEMSKPMNLPLSYDAKVNGIHDDCGRFMATTASIRRTVIDREPVKEAAWGVSGIAFVPRSSLMSLR